MSEDRVNPYQIQGSRVYGQGMSINCTNKITALQLQSTLNQYETTIQHYKQTQQQYTEIETKLDRIQKTIIQLQLTAGIMNEELKKLHQEVI